MASYAWAKSRSILSRLWPLFGQSFLYKKVDHQISNETAELKVMSNERYLSALKDGGIWLS